ncbi:MAG: SDR family NAD(P)-dependent oxidoreductase [Aureliella sp.]
MAICARSADDLQTAVSELREMGVDVAAAPCDVREAEQVDDFIAQLTQQWNGVDVLINVAGIITVGPLDAMELTDFEDSMHGDKPIHWKETLDDLMYYVNFHMEKLSAEDHQVFRKVIQPFLMNVIAAMPLQSASTLLWLHDAGKLQIVSGLVKVVDKRDGETVIEVDDGPVERRYRMFIDCSGHKPITIDTYPFRSLVEDGTVTTATAAYRHETSPPEELDGTVSGLML